MKTEKIRAIIKTSLYFIAFAAIIVACDTEQGMMHGNGGSMDTGSWNWAPILISLVIGFLLGYLVARKRK